MTTSQRRTGARLLAGAHLLQAAVLVVQPGRLVRAVAGDRGVPPAWIMRVLGARLLIQAIPEALAPRGSVLRLGVGVDLAHAASMIVCARVWPRYRRAALASAGSAGVSALAGVLILRARR